MKFQVIKAAALIHPYPFTAGDSFTEELMESRGTGKKGGKGHMISKTK